MRVITTLAELIAVKDGTVLLTANVGFVEVRRWPWDDDDDDPQCFGFGSDQPMGLSDRSLPATVLREPTD